MSKQDKVQISELQRKVDQAVFQDIKTNITDDPFLKTLSDNIKSLAANSFIGTVAFAGQASNGSFNVQFNTGNTGYSSSWPQWAFDQAKPALLYEKRLWVISNGDPFGSNLLTVLILS